MKTTIVLTLALSLFASYGGPSQAQNKIEIKPSFRDEDENSSPSYYYPAETETGKIAPPPLSASVPKTQVPVEEVKIQVLPPPVPEMKPPAAAPEVISIPPIREIKQEVKPLPMVEKPAAEIHPAPEKTRPEPRPEPVQAIASKPEFIPAPPVPKALAQPVPRSRSVSDSEPRSSVAQVEPASRPRPDAIPATPAPAVQAHPVFRSHPDVFPPANPPVRIPAPEGPSVATPAPAPQVFPAFPSPSSPNLPPRMPEAIPPAGLGNSDPYNEALPNLSSLRREAYVLGSRNIEYRIGINHPAYGGLDSSGSVQHLLSEIGVIGVPRTILGMYEWLRSQRSLHEFRVRPTESELSQTLAPGNLIFWGDMGTGKITHVMVYLGYDQSRGKHLAFGSRGGIETGINQSQIDIFELKLNREKLVATGRVPGLLLR